jgi:phosphonopyruvate decarboxylase
LRGEPGGPGDEPQHELMGAITTDMLELMQVPWEYFPDAEDAVADSLERACCALDAGRSFALVMRKGSVAKHALKSRAAVREPALFAGDIAAPVAQRHEILAAIQAHTGESTGAVLIGTTGYTGRELYACADRANQLYMVGSMGCAVSLGLGIALVQPQRKVVVLDGDGAALMRLGAQGIAGYERPANLVHVLLDNSIHESTGGQATVAPSVNFCAIAAACGYENVSSIATPDRVAEAVATSSSNTFIHVPMLPGVPEDLPRPAVTPAAVGERFREFLKP